MGLWKFQFEFIYLPEKNQNTAYKVKGNANYITKRIRNNYITREEAQIETVGAHYYDWIRGNDYCCGVGY